MKRLHDPPPPPLAANVALSTLQCQLAAENLCVAASHLLSLIRILRLSLLIMDEETISAEEGYQSWQANQITERAMALADQYGGFTKTVEAMQAMAHNLQANDTHVVNPSGLDAAGQLTSAYDMALIAAAAMKIPDFRTVANTKSYAFPGYMPKPGHVRKTFQIYTENRLLRHNYRGIAGGKTGFTSLAHRTFWAAAERNGHILVVTLFQIHEPTEQAAKELLNWGFDNRTKVSPIGSLVAPLSAVPTNPSDPATPLSAASTTTSESTSESTSSAPASNTPWIWIGALGGLGLLAATFLLRRSAVTRRKNARIAGRHATGTANLPERLDEPEYVNL
jgi:D-alanyl-D-alanine carboxypeptidase (penicillin-binding protein 5/6)